MDISLERKYKNLEKRLNKIWPDWHLLRHIGTGAYSEVYEIHRNHYGEEISSALKIIQLDADGIPVRCETASWNNVFFTPDEEPTASLLQRTLKQALSSDQVSFDAPGAPTPSAVSDSTSFHNDSSPGYTSSGLHFSEEISIMRQLLGAPNIVSIEDYFFQPVESGTLIFIRMELLTCLSEILRSESAKPLTVSDVRKLGVDICRALIYCERIHILHRDIKPGNLFIDRFGDYKVGDFGISKPLKTLSNPDYTLGTGTVSYMAPEVWARREYGKTVDIYSLGIVLYQLLNKNRVPFLPQAPAKYTKEDLKKANDRRFAGEPLPFIPTIDHDLQLIIRKACSFLPEDRYASAEDFYKALSAWTPKTEPVLPGDTTSCYDNEPTASIKGNAGTIKRGTDRRTAPSPVSGRADAPSGKETEEPGSTVPSPERPEKGDVRREATGPSSRQPGPNPPEGPPTNIRRWILTGAAIAAAILLIAVLYSRITAWKPAKGTDAAMADSSRTVYSAATDQICPGFVSLVQENTKKIDAIELSIDDSVLEHSLLAALNISGDKLHLKDTINVTKLNLKLQSSDKGKAFQDLSGLAWFPELQQVSLLECGLSDSTDYSGLQSLPDLQILDLQGNNISSLTPFETLSGLQWLDLSANNIKDLSPLSRLSDLKSLALSRNEIPDISPLSGMTELLELYLDENSISDLAPLEKLTGLQTLRLDNNKISDLSPLKNLTSLRSLALSNNKITDLAPLESLTAMEELWLAGNKIISIDPLSGMSRLTYLNLRNNQISSLSSLKKMGRLTDLILSKNSIKELSPLENAKKLVYLDLEENKISDLSSLRKLSSLEALYLNNNAVSDLTPVKDLTGLKTLTLGKNKIKDLSPLKGLTSLESLDLFTNEIESISSLSDLQKLTWLNIGRNKISDLTPVTKMKNLETLQIYRNSISDITSVEDLNSLKYLVADVNTIGSLQPLQNLKKLESLFIEYNNIQDVSPLKDLKNLKEVYLAGNSVNDYSPLESLPESTKIYKESR